MSIWSRVIERARTLDGQTWGLVLSAIGCGIAGVVRGVFEDSARDLVIFSAILIAGVLVFIGLMCTDAIISKLPWPKSSGGSHKDSTS